jgi:hypothetical protein
VDLKETRVGLWTGLQWFIPNPEERELKEKYVLTKEPQFK